MEKNHLNRKKKQEMSNKHLKDAYSFIRDLLVETTMKCHCMDIRMAKVKNTYRNICVSGVTKRQNAD